MSEEKKIIVDEDWKSRVAAEKEAAASHAGPTAASEGKKPGDVQAGSSPESRPPRGSLPPASFDLLVTGFVTEAMVALGQLPNPMTGKDEPNREHARYAIDMLGVLAEKTKGNLEPEEERGLQEVLHQLRMAFVGVGMADGE